MSAAAGAAAAAVLGAVETAMAVTTLGGVVVQVAVGIAMAGGVEAVTVGTAGDKRPTTGGWGMMEAGGELEEQPGGGVATASTRAPWWGGGLGRAGMELGRVRVRVRASRHREVAPGGGVGGLRVLG